MATVAPQTVYWVGQDGNAYVKAPNGTVSNYGVPTASGANGVETKMGSVQGAQIQDPNPGGGSQNTNNSPAPASSTGGGTTYADKSNDISVQNAGLASVGATQDAGISKLDQALATIKGQYGSDIASANTSYGNETVANQNDLQGNKQTSLEHAVSGRQGLYGTLASLGALSGTGVELANNAVQKGANADLTTAADTYATNQNGLDNGYNSYIQQEKRLQDNAQATHDNNVQQVKNDAYKQQQTYLKGLADDYAAEGNAGQAKNYTDQLSALFPSIAATNVPTIDMGYTGSAYTAPTLASYVGKANNTSVSSTPAAPTNNPLNVPGLIALNKKQTG